MSELLCDENGIFVPNAFSPNGDGLNDVFRPRGEGIESMIMAVFDRWGNKVFEGSDIDVGWDGTWNGQALSSDGFGYIIDFVCEGNITFRLHGNVTLIR